MKTNQNVVKGMGLALLMAMAGGMTACSDEEISATFGLIAVGAEVIAISTGHHYVCEGGYRSVCHEWCDHRGRRHRECRQEYDSCIVQRWVGKVVAGDEEAKQQLNDVAMADAFGMSYASAGKFIEAVESARSGNFSLMNDLGLGRSDLLRITRHKMPSDAGVDALALKLDMEPAAARDMLQRLIDQAAQKH